MDELTFSVIVATRNRQWDIGELLASLAETGRAPILEVILVDDASEIAVTADTSQPWPVTVIRNKQQAGAAVSRNIAAESARGDVLAFLDDDARVFPDWFDVASEALTSCRAVTGRIVPLDDGIVSRGRQWRYEARYSKLSPKDPVSFFAGGNSAVFTEDFLAAGGFPDLESAADNELVKGLEKVGTVVEFEPRLRILHRNSKGIRKAAVEAWRSGKTRRPLPPSRAVQDIHASFGAAPWKRDSASAVMNVALQVLHSASSIYRDPARNGSHFRSNGR